LRSHGQPSMSSVLFGAASFAELMWLHTLGLAMRSVLEVAEFYFYGCDDMIPHILTGGKFVLLAD